MTGHKSPTYTRRPRPTSQLYAGPSILQPAAILVPVAVTCHQRGKLLFDLLLLILLLAAFSGAAWYIQICLNLTRRAQPPERTK